MHPIPLMLQQGKLQSTSKTPKSGNIPRLMRSVFTNKAGASNILIFLKLLEYGYRLRFFVLVIWVRSGKL